MTTAKVLYPTERRIYHPELLTCPHCGTPTALLNYLTSDKIVQTLTTPLALAIRPSHCPDPACPGFALRLRSITAQHLALPGCTYGFDVVARLGWLRQHQHLTFAQVHAALTPAVHISETHVRTLYQEAYLPLLAASTRAHHAAVTQLADQHGGLLLALDGLAPVGGEPQLWCIYEVLTGLLLRAGWLSVLDQVTFAAFLQPVAATWPVRAVLSDKQVGLPAAIQTVFPTAVHQLCQAHYLARLADPLITADVQLVAAARKAMRAGVGADLRADRAHPRASSTVLTVTGLLPEPLITPAPALPITPPPVDLPPSRARTEPTSEPAPVAALVSEVLRRVQYLLNLRGHRLDHLAGLETVAGLEEVRTLSRQLLTHRAHPILTRLVATITTTLETVAEELRRLRHGVGWLTDIRALLDPTQTLAVSGAAVAADLSAYLERMDQQAGGDRFLEQVVERMWGVSRRYWRGLFHTYDQAGLPRTNNAVESRFREVRRRLRRTTGQAGATATQLQRAGAWELVGGAGSAAAQQAALAAVDPTMWQEERARVREQRGRFRLHSRYAARTRTQLEQLRQAWFALPGDMTG